MLALVSRHLYSVLISRAPPLWAVLARARVVLVYWGAPYWVAAVLRWRLPVAVPLVTDEGQTVPVGLVAALTHPCR